MKHFLNFSIYLQWFLSVHIVPLDGLTAPYLHILEPNKNGEINSGMIYKSLIKSHFSVVVTNIYVHISANLIIEAFQQ